MREIMKVKTPENGISEGLSPLTRFYLMWRWINGEEKPHFDDSGKLVQSTGIGIGKEWRGV